MSDRFLELRFSLRRTAGDERSKTCGPAKDNGRGDAAIAAPSKARDNVTAAEGIRCILQPLETAGQSHVGRTGLPSSSARTIFPSSNANQTPPVTSESKMHSCSPGMFSPPESSFRARRRAYCPVTTCLFPQQQTRETAIPSSHDLGFTYIRRQGFLAGRKARRQTRR
ncbi:hypothetical protein MTO96_010311 [Rhipicephalus appendiculatus]